MLLDLLTPLTGALIAVWAVLIGLAVARSLVARLTGA